MSIAPCPCCSTAMRTTRTKTEGYALTCPACSCQAFARSPKSANALTARLEAKPDDDTRTRQGSKAPEGKGDSRRAEPETKARPAAKAGADAGAAADPRKPKRRSFLDDLLS